MNTAGAPHDWWPLGVLQQQQASVSRVTETNHTDHAYLLTMSIVQNSPPPSVTAKLQPEACMAPHDRHDAASAGASSRCPGPHSTRPHAHRVRVYARRA